MVWSPAPTSNTDDAAGTSTRASASDMATDRSSGLSFGRARALTVEVATTAEHLSALKPDYDRLHVVCRNTLPFALHEWHAVWWDHLAKTAGAVRDELRIHVVRDDRGDCVSIVPFVSTRREVGCFKTESLSLLGADPNFTELRCPLVVPGSERLAADAVARRLAAEGEWDWGARLVPFQEGIQTRPRMRSRVTYAAYRRLLGGQRVEPKGWVSAVRRTLPIRSWA